MEKIVFYIFYKKKIYKFLKAISKKYSLISEVMVLAISQNQPSNSMNAVSFERSTVDYDAKNAMYNFTGIKGKNVRITSIPFQLEQVRGCSS